MKSLRNSFAAVAAVCVLTASAFAAAADPSGTYKFQVAGGRGGGNRGGQGGAPGGAAPAPGAAAPAPTMTEYTLVLALKAGKLTGTVSVPARGGQGDPTVTEITDASFDAAKGTVAFSMATPAGGRGGQGGAPGGAAPGGAAPAMQITKYTGTLAGDKITGTRTPPARGGAEPMPVEWVATKGGAAAAPAAAPAAKK